MSATHEQVSTGGGGSSFAANASTFTPDGTAISNMQGAFSSTGATTLPPNTADSGYTTWKNTATAKNVGEGAGGNGSNQDGGPGLVIIEW